MAAYASLVSLAQTTQNFLLDDHDQERVKCLHEHLIFLQAFLEDFPNELANNLEGRIRDLADQAEDILQNFIWKEMQAVLTFPQRKRGRKFRADFQALNPLLGKIAEEITSIVEEVIEFKNRSKSTEDVIQSNDFGDGIASMSSMELAPTSKDSSMVGFDDDLMAIMTRLCGESSELQIIPIFGMGGIGKTTLARNAFNDSLTAEHFHIRAWVTVSQEYSAHEILSSLWRSINGVNEGCEGRNESIQEKVYKSLKGRRYLIVMDDMWSKEAWDDVMMMFPNDHNGSRIMLTTRLLDVATYPNSGSPLHEMHFLDAEQSWDLLKQKVFARESCPPELESIGKTIAASCRGLPLAIVLIAGLLTTASRRPHLWENIARNVKLAVKKTNDEQFTKILSLSYIHLPRHLRPCFLYMGLFPEDYEIHASKLIKLWVAEGFLKPNEHKILEEVAEEYLEDLVKRSLVLVNQRKSNGKIKSCSVHDLVRDLCIRKAEEDKFLLLARSVSPSFPHCIKKQHRISIGHAKLSCANSYAPRIDHTKLSCLIDIYGSTIHTIIYFQNSIEPSFSCLGNFRLLRVLDVIRWANLLWHDSEVLESLPVEVYELFHLRYLAFDYPLISIPAAIANLQNLQTLIIHPSRSSVSCTIFLPPEIWRMPHLRHIISFPFYLLPNTEGLSFALKSLQTLSEAIDFVCTEKILRMVPNLKKLGITFVVSKDIEDCHLENLVHLHQLEKLKLRVHPKFGGKLNPIFPASLKKLILTGKWGFSWKYFGEIVGLLPKLEVLKLRKYLCNENTWETSEGEFLQLKYLSIENSSLRQWLVESSHFPRLKCLRLLDCPWLFEIPDGIGEIPTLERIEVDNLNQHLIKSAKRIQEEQQENLGNDTLQVGADNMAFEMRRWKNERWDDIRIQTEIAGEGYSNSMDGEQITKIVEQENSRLTNRLAGEYFKRDESQVPVPYEMMTPGVGHRIPGGIMLSEKLIRPC